MSVPLHPNWTELNREQLETPDTFDRTILETLFESLCIKCGREMGEHQWHTYRFTCPEGKK